MYRTATLSQEAPSTLKEDGTACKSLNRNPGLSCGRGAVEEIWLSISHAWAYQ